LISNSVRYNRGPGFNSQGGGVFVAGNGARLTATGNTIQGNLVGSNGSGGGIHIDYLSTAVVNNNKISSNTGGWIAGGILVGAQSSADIISNTIHANNADKGGGIGVNNASAWISSNLILSNTTRLWGGGGLRIQETSTVTIANNLIAYNGSYIGRQSSGGMEVSNSVIALLQNSITSNTSYYDGAFALGEGAQGIVDGNFVAFNVTSDTVDSLSISSAAPITFTNNMIANNNAKFTIYGQNTSVVNNTIVNNNGGLIVWGNTAQASLVRNNILASTSFGVKTGDGGTIAVMDYNDAWGNTRCDFCGLTGAGNISANPQFVNAPNGDYHLRLGSPAMNAGTNTNAPGYDKDSVKRPQMGRVDMGAYEVVAPGSVYLPTILK